MKYEILVSYPDEQFRRMTGVKRATFCKMVETLRQAYAAKHLRRGRTLKLCIEDMLDMLLATLEYLLEYRTYAHIAASFGLAGSNMYRTIRRVEDALIKDGTFSLSGRKALVKSDMEYEIILIDTTEAPIERPKRGRRNGIPGRKSGTQ